MILIVVLVVAGMLLVSALAVGLGRASARADREMDEGIARTGPAIAGGKGAG